MTERIPKELYQECNCRSTQAGQAIPSPKPWFDFNKFQIFQELVKMGFSSVDEMIKETNKIYNELQTQG